VAKTGHPNFDYSISSPWRTGAHTWHLVGNHSGSSFNASDAKTFMEGVASPFALCFAPFIEPSHSSVVRSAYYDGETSAPVYVAIYDTDNPAPTPLHPTATGFAHSGSTSEPLEVCVMLEARAGLSSRSKPVYMRKFIHCIPVDNLGLGTGGVPQWTFTSAAASAAAAMGDGSWFGNRVYCSPSGRQPSTNDWVAQVQPGNHQMPRGRKRKSVSTSSSLFNDALQLAEAATGIVGRALA
jgi:hypothetical protein